MGAADEYIVHSYIEFKEMGLRAAAVQMLKEGILAYPQSLKLRDLAKSEGVDIGEVSVQAKATQSSQQVDSSNVDVSALAMSPLPMLAATRSSKEESLLQIRGSDFWQLVHTHGLPTLLKERGGCVQVMDVLPNDATESILQTLESLNVQEWIENKPNQGADASHFYYRYDGCKINDARRQLSALAPDYFNNFQAAKYLTSGHIERHDDSNYFIVPDDPAWKSERWPAGTVLYRKIAVILYLTKDWRREYGGCLVDMHREHEPKYIIPRFNSMVTFLVPRVHEVERLADGCPPRFTVFGWFSDDRFYPKLTDMGPEMSTVDERVRGYKR